MSSNHFQSDNPLIHRAQMWQFRRLSQERLGHIYCRFRIIQGAAIVFFPLVMCGCQLEWVYKFH